MSFKAPEDHSSTSTSMLGHRFLKYLRLPRAGVFVLSPFLGLIYIFLLPVAVLVMTIVCLTRVAFAQQPIADGLNSREARQCLGCHSKAADDSATGAGVGIQALLIRRDDFQGSAHKFLPCTGCHLDAMTVDHSDKSVKKSDRSIAMMKACRKCHTSEQLSAKPVHDKVMTRTSATTCWSCHGNHNIQRVWRWKASLSEADYCLTCHHQQLAPEMIEAVDANTLRGSVHAKHRCADCHPAMNMDEHPIVAFKNARELAQSVSKSCFKCHSSAYKEFEGSIHSNLVQRGVERAPVCTDCHGAHAVGKKALLDTMSGVPCKKCHEETFKVYSSSVHGNARMQGDGSAPMCSSCHSAHRIRPAVASKPAKGACLDCHKKVDDVHRVWLPNVEAHFGAVACSSCHTSGPQRGIFLRVTDTKTGETVVENRVKDVMGTTYEGLMREAQSTGIEGPRLWTMYRKLNENSRIHLSATLALQDAQASHKIMDKSRAIKQCDVCHQAGSDFFKTVMVAVSNVDGKEIFHSVNPVAINSIFGTIPVSQFYAIGGNRMRELDLAGLGMGIGGIAGVGLHGVLRLVTRRRRREEAA